MENEIKELIAKKAKEIWKRHLDEMEIDANHQPAMAFENQNPDTLLKASTDDTLKTYRKYPAFFDKNSSPQAYLNEYLDNQALEYIIGMVFDSTLKQQMDLSLVPAKTLFEQLVEKRYRLVWNDMILEANVPHTAGDLMKYKEKVERKISIESNFFDVAVEKFDPTNLPQIVAKYVDDRFKDEDIRKDLGHELETLERGTARDVQKLIREKGLEDELWPKVKDDRTMIRWIYEGNIDINELAKEYGIDVDQDQDPSDVIPEAKVKVSAEVRRLFENNHIDWNDANENSSGGDIEDQIEDLVIQKWGELKGANAKQVANAVIDESGTDFVEVAKYNLKEMIEDIAYQEAQDNHDSAGASLFGDAVWDKLDDCGWTERETKRLDKVYADEVAEMAEAYDSYSLDFPFDDDMYKDLLEEDRNDAIYELGKLLEREINNSDAGDTSIDYTGDDDLILAWAGDDITTEEIIEEYRDEMREYNY